MFLIHHRISHVFLDNSHSFSMEYYDSLKNPNFYKFSFSQFETNGSKLIPFIEGRTILKFFRFEFLILILIHKVNQFCWIRFTYSSANSIIAFPVPLMPSNFNLVTFA